METASRIALKFCVCVFCGINWRFLWRRQKKISRTHLSGSISLFVWAYMALYGLWPRDFLKFHNLRRLWRLRDPQSTMGRFLRVNHNLESKNEPFLTKIWWENGFSGPCRGRQETWNIHRMLIILRIFEDFWTLWRLGSSPKWYGVVSKGKMRPRIQKWRYFDEKMMRKWVFRPLLRPPRNLKYSQNAYNLRILRYFEVFWGCVGVWRLVVGWF